MRNAAGVAEETARLEEKTASTLAAGKALRCDVAVSLVLSSWRVVLCSCAAVCELVV